MDAAALVLVVLVACLVVLHAETCRRWLMRSEDARTMAAFRIACGVCTIGWTIELLPLLDYLFSDEGLFLTDTARQVFASQEFAGIADGSVAHEAAGPLDAVAVLQLLASPRQSLLFFWDDPYAVRLHVLALLGAAVLFTLGLGTAVTKWLTLLLYQSFAARNSVFWAGEQVFSNFLLLTCLSRCGRAYSLDAWQRARRGGVALDRSIPGWPRALALLQTIPLFTANGLAKSGETWAAGDAFHYMVMHPHFHRFDPTALASLFSTNLFRVMTWVTHGFELLFPLAIVGVVLRFQRSAGSPRLTGARRFTAQLVWIATAVAVATCAAWTLQDRERRTLCFVVVIVASILTVLLAIGGRWLRPVRLRALVLDREWIHRWLLGRRVWVALLVVFTGNLMIFTTIGWFVPLTMATAILFFDGEEIGRFLGRMRRSSPANPRLERSTGASERAVLSDATLATALGVLVVAGLATVVSGSAFGWSATLTLVGVALALVVRRGIAGGAKSQLRRARARFMVGWFCAFHVTSVTLVLLPSGDPPAKWRAPIEAPFRRWLAHAHALQVWQMFAPNGSRSVVALEVEVTSANGETIAIGSGIPAPVGGVLQLGRDKGEKVARRIAGGEGSAAGWYAKWHGRHVCRRWALEHGGELPQEVTLLMGVRPIAPPEAYADPNPRIVEQIEQRRRLDMVWQGHCADEIHGQPITADGFRPWEKPRAQTWSELRASGDAPDLPWPLAILGLPWLVLRAPRPRAFVPPT